MLRATTTYTFSKSELEKSGPHPLVCYTLDLEMCFAPQRRALFGHLNFQKWSALHILNWKCASHHNSVHFLDIATSKFAPNMRCFVHVDLEMCFAPQRCASVRHRNFYFCSEAEVFCTFWNRNVLRATTACKCATSQLLNLLRSSNVLYILISKCASRHNGVQLFMSHLARWLCALEPQIIGKNRVHCDFPTFSRTCIFSLLIFSPL